MFVVRNGSCKFLHNSRKSKWDQPAPSAALGQTAPIGKPISIPATIQPSITTNATGTKGTVISAFGSLPKKPKV